MRARPFLLLLLAGVVGGLGWWRWPRRIEFTNLPPRATGPWVAFGDSLTAGFGAAEGRDYPSQLARPRRPPGHWPRSSSPRPRKTTELTLRKSVTPRPGGVSCCEMRSVGE